MPPKSAQNNAKRRRSSEPADLSIPIDKQRVSWTKLGQCLRILLRSSVQYGCSLKLPSRDVTAKVCLVRSGELTLIREESERWDEVGMSNVLSFRLSNAALASSLKELFARPSPALDLSQPQVCSSEEEENEEVSLEASPTERRSSNLDSRENEERLVELMTKVTEASQRQLSETLASVVKTVLEARQPSKEETTEPAADKGPETFHILDLESWKKKVIPLDPLLRRHFITAEFLRPLHGVITPTVDHELDMILMTLDVAANAKESFWSSKGPSLLQTQAARLHYYAHKDFAVAVRLPTFLETLRLDGAFQNPILLNAVVSKLEKKYSNRQQVCGNCKQKGHYASNCPKNGTPRRSFGRKK